jgi:hypothetical protein
MLKIKIHFSYWDFSRAGERALYMYGLPGTAEIQKTTVKGWGHRLKTEIPWFFGLLFTLLLG